MGDTQTISITIMVSITNKKITKKDYIYSFYLPLTLELFKPITNAILFYSRTMTMPGICTYQFTSPDRSTFLTFLLND